MSGQRLSSTDAASLSRLLDRIREIVGARYCLTAEDDVAPYVTEERGLYHGRTPMVVRPATTAEVSDVVRLCAEAGQPIVPQGGNTGLVGGGVPYEEGREIVLSLGRLNRIRALDAENDTMTVEAGAILANIQKAALEADRLFPLSLAAEGTCQIGGNLSTNAGGTQVLRYGNARDLVLGLEVVLPDGRVWDGLKGLRKDNTGYDLKHLFLGAEGTLGVITAAVLKLFPKPRDRQTALAAVPDTKAAVRLLNLARRAAGEAVTGFELMGRTGLDFVFAHVPGRTDPFAQAYDWYVLIELASTQEEGSLRPALEEFLAAGFEEGIVLDAVIAESEARRAELWAFREDLPGAQKPEGGSIKHDISVPVSRIAEFIERASEACRERLPGIRPVPFGHIGDGNVHFNLTQPVAADTGSFLARWTEFNGIVHGIAAELGGSISAEHGLGRLKREEIRDFKSSLELELMRRIKDAIDPRGIMNPGKVL